MSKPDPRNEPCEQDNANMLAEKELGLVQEMWAFLSVRKKFWLAPIILALVALGLIFAFAGTHATVAPFLYAL
ncbi:MAG: hypothetical protein HYV27_17985 [Candidatus Hydrogenedentes bacterium]|nr:hypothetical protein [Candidatus Hydrogenedentota bacterium]